MKPLKLLASPFQRRFGTVSCLMFAGLAAEEIFVMADGGAAGPLASALRIAVFLGCAVAALASARMAALGIAQPAALIVAAATRSLSYGDPWFALLSAMIGTFLLLRLGFFARAGMAKAALLALTVALVSFGPVLLSPRPERAFLAATICSLAYAGAVATLATGKYLAPWKRDKPVLALRGLGLTESERRTVGQLLAGMNAKEIASERGLARSTVRNQLCKVYAKLGIRGSEELTALAERYELG